MFCQHCLLYCANPANHHPGLCRASHTHQHNPLQRHALQALHLAIHSCSKRLLASQHKPSSATASMATATTSVAQQHKPHCKHLAGTAAAVLAGHARPPLQGCLMQDAPQYKHSGSAAMHSCCRRSAACATLSCQAAQHSSLFTPSTTQTLRVEPPEQHALPAGGRAAASGACAAALPKVTSSSLQACRL